MKGWQIQSRVSVSAFGLTKRKTTTTTTKKTNINWSRQKGNFFSRILGFSLGRLASGLNSLAMSKLLCIFQHCLSL